VGLLLDIGIAKVNKYASRDSGDTAEVVERPGGGFSIVVVDGQGSGPGSKALSMLLTAKAVMLIKEGVRDGAVARAVHDTLLAYRGGKVSASLDIVSADLKHRSLVLTRNGSSPAIVVRNGAATIVPAEQGAIGLYPFTRPSVSSFPLEAGLQLWVVTDGIIGAGMRWQADHESIESRIESLANSDLTANDQAASLLTGAIELDRLRPADDMTVATLRVFEDASGRSIRSMQLTIPIP
jgi:serine phosphatase RsbU (regulator of sigma subunit)